MNIKSNLRRFTELGIGVTSVATLAIAGCGGGGGSNGNPTASVVSISGTVSTFAGSSGTPGYTDNAASSVARFTTPTYIATDGTNLYVAEMGNNTIRRIDIATGAVSTFAGSLAGASGVADGSGTGALFNKPEGLVTDGTNLYVADTLNNNIRQISLSTSQVTTIAGSTTGASGVTNATGTNARFNHPIGITKVGTSLYVSDTSSSTIRKIDLANSNAVTTFAGSPLSPGYSTGYASTLARLSAPTGLTNDGTNLYVADMGNNDIRQIIISTQMVSTLAGSTWVNPVSTALGITASGVTDGTGTTARFNGPTGLTTDGTNLYVTDTWNHTIRKVELGTRVVTTLAGTALSIGVTDAASNSARFSSPRGIVYNNGALYVSDYGNNSIRRIK